MMIRDFQAETVAFQRGILNEEMAKLDEPETLFIRRCFPPDGVPPDDQIESAFNLIQRT